MTNIIVFILFLYCHNILKQYFLWHFTCTFCTLSGSIVDFIYHTGVYTVEHNVTDMQAITAWNTSWVTNLCIVLTKPWEGHDQDKSMKLWKCKRSSRVTRKKWNTDLRELLNAQTRHNETLWEIASKQSNEMEWWVLKHRCYCV